MTETRTIVKRNEKLTKREVLRRIANRTHKTNGQFHAMSYAISYIARRLGFEGDYAKTISFVNWMKKNQGINVRLEGKKFIFAR